jgi:hypothetical protein
MSLAGSGRPEYKKKNKIKFNKKRNHKKKETIELVGWTKALGEAQRTQELRREKQLDTQSWE